MAIVIPASDLASTLLNNNVTAAATAVTNAKTAASATVPFLTALHGYAQYVLLLHLVSSGACTPNGILNSITYGV